MFFITQEPFWIHVLRTEQNYSLEMLEDTKGLIRRRKSKDRHTMKWPREKGKQ